MKLHLLFFSVCLSLLLIGAVAAQEIAPPPRESKLGFSPRENIKRLAASKAQTIDRQIDYEKQFQPLLTTNWQEYDIEYYDVNWRVSDTNRNVYGAVGIYGRPTVSALDSIIVNLDDGLTVDSIYNSSGILSYSRIADHITVRLERAYTPSEQFGFTVVYHGIPAPGPDGHRGLTLTFRGRTFYVFSSSEPYHARQWWPCNDITADKADSMDIRITVDTSLTASSNGILVSNTDNGDATRTFYWKHRYPISPYLVCLNIYAYDVWTDYYHYSPTDSMPIVNHVFPDIYANSLDTLSVTAYALGLFADLFGEYPFINEKYGHTYSEIGGMEHQTNTSVNTRTTQETVVHEISHHWWGNMVTCHDWHNLWINEGFATYCEGLYYESIGGAEFYRDYMYDISYIEYPDGSSVYVNDTSGIWDIFTWRVYAKGAWVLHMLRGIVGDDTFFEIMNQFRTDFAFETAATQDFQAVCESVSGMDFDTFFQQWIYGICQPYYYYSMFGEENPGGGWDVYVHLRQGQPSSPDVFEMPIEMDIAANSGDTVRFAVFNNQRKQNFMFHIDNQPQGILLDPDNWVLSLEDQEQYGVHILNDDLSDGIMEAQYLDSIIVNSEFPDNDYACTVTDGQFPVGWSLDPASGVISGITYASGDIQFTVEVTDELLPEIYADTMTYNIYLEPVADRPGDANVDGEINVGDAVYSIAYIFSGGPPPPVLNWADVNGDCMVNVGDVVYLVAFIFKSGEAPQPGCVD